MLIQNSIFRNNYTADGTTTTFAYTTPVLEKSWLAVYQQLPDAETQTLVPQTDYSLTGIGSSSAGNVVFNTAPVAGTKLAFVLNVPISQLYKYTELDNFPAESHEDALAKLTLICQMIWEKANRAITVSETSTRTPTEYSDDFFEAADQVRQDAIQVATDRMAVETAVDGFDDHVDDAKDDISAFTTEKLFIITSAGGEQVSNINTAGATQVSSVNSAGSAQTGLVNNAGSTQTAAVNSAGATQLAAVNNAGSTQTAAVNSAGSTQLAAVNSAGAAQVGLVEDEGDDQTDRVEEAGDAKISAINAAYAEYIAHYNALTSLVTTMSEAASAPGSVSIDWTTNTLNFAVPRGPAGSQGPQGPAGDITTALNAVYINFEIDNNGNLILHTTDVSAATFAITGGDLIMTY